MTDVTSIDWAAKAKAANYPHQAFINGKNVDSVTGKTEATINPANGQVIADIADCSPEDADIAIKVARDTFESGVWANMAPGDRKRILLKWAQLIEDNLEELALFECVDAGKPISDTYGIDVPSAVNTIRWTAEATDKVYEEIAPTGHDTIAMVTRLPLGVIAAIVPWNFPLSTTAWKLAPALATGNSVILKPDPKTH